MNKKRLLSVVGLVVLGSISWIGAYALNINSSSFDAGYPIFKKIIFSLLGSENSPVGVQIDENGIYLSSSALPGTAGNIIKVGNDDKFIKSTIQNGDIASGAIGPQHIATGGVTNQDIGNLQISNHHILINSLNTGVFASDINFVSGGLFYFANGVCQGSNGISAITNGNVVCSPIPNLGSGGIGAGCIEGQTPVMDINGQWTCQGVLLGSEGDGDMYWNGNNGYTCTKWFDGCNTCAYENPNDPANSNVMCNQAYCAPSEYSDAYCISGFSGYTTGVNNAFTYTGIKDIWNANQTTPGFVGVGLTTPTETLQAAQDVRVDNNTDANGIGEVYCHKTDSWVPSSMYNISLCAVCETAGYVYNPSTNVCEKIECSGTGNQSTNGSCGGSHGSSFSSIPNNNLCTAGEPTVPYLSTNGLSWIWLCKSTNGGTEAYCSANYTSLEKINGQCGSTNGQTLNTSPSVNLCSAGSATTVIGVGPWSWSCQGLNGGIDVACSANKTETPVNGICGSSHGGSFTNTPTTNLCSAGSATTVTGVGPWSWSCQGLNGGINASCSTINNNCVPAPSEVCSALGYQNIMAQGGGIRQWEPREINNENNGCQCRLGFLYGAGGEGERLQCRSRTCSTGSGSGTNDSNTQGNTYTCQSDGYWGTWSEAGPICSPALPPIDMDTGAGGQSFSPGQTQCTTRKPSQCSCIASPQEPIC